jgi:large subunit ribosomal protein L15
MRQNDLRPPEGARRSRKRVGRGDSSGYGSYSGRGVKGQKSRSGGGVRLGFQGGGLRLIKALPMIRGFTNVFRKDYSVVNIDRLGGFPASTEVTLDVLVKSGLVRDLRKPVKILGRGELDVSLVVEGHKFSTQAREKIESAGGSVRELS